MNQEMQVHGMIAIINLEKTITKVQEEVIEKYPNHPKLQEEAQEIKDDIQNAIGFIHRYCVNQVTGDTT